MFFSELFLEGSVLLKCESAVKKGNIELNAQDWCLNMWRLWHKLTKDRKFKVKAVTHAVSHVMEKQH